MKKPIQIFTILGITICALACSSPKSSENEISEEPEASEAVEAVATPKTAIMISHTVADFDLWLEAFNANDSIRNAGSLTNESVHQGTDDTNLVIVTAYTQSHESARAFAGNPGLKAAMEEAGVTSKPAISFWDINWERGDDSNPEFEGIFFVGHAVADYDSWIEKFHLHDSARLANGMYALLVGVNADSLNHIGLYFGSTDVSQTKALLSDTTMAKVMKDAGVLGPPSVTQVSLIK